MQWYWIDIAIILIIGLSVITGLFRGFLKELIALSVWIVAIWLAYNYASVLYPWLGNYIQDQTVIKIASFVIVLTATVIIGGIINALLGFILKRSGLSGTDRLLGMGFGFIRGVFIVSLIIVVIRMTSLPQEEYVSQSRLYSKFTPVVDWISSKVPDLINQAKSLDQTNSLADFPSDFELSQS